MKDLWQRLQDEGRPIVFYGTGNGADKIADELEKRGLAVSGVFASDGFVRSRTYRGLSVLSYEEARRAFGDGMTVLLVFGSSRPEMLDLFDRLDREVTLRVPDVPVAGGPLFDAAFVQEHREELVSARALLADDASRALFDTVVETKLSGVYDGFRRHLSEEDEIKALLALDAVTTAVDLGAYVGDTALELIGACPTLTRLWALEPDTRNYRKLCENTAEKPAVLPIHAAAWEEDIPLTFSVGGGRGIRQGVAAKTVTVDGRAVDTLVGTTPIDYIKLDVEGAEWEALHGAAGVITRDKPRLRVALYHRSDDLFRLPLYLHSLRPDYRFYLRRRASVPMWELDLLAL